MNDWRCMTADKSQQTNHRRQVILNIIPCSDDFEVRQSCMIHEIMINALNYEVAKEGRYACISGTGGMALPCTILRTT